MAMDVLLSVGLPKLLASMFLAEEVYTKGMEDASGSLFYRSLPVALGPILLFESTFYPKRAAMMNGPLLKTCRGRCQP